MTTSTLIQRAAELVIEFGLEHTGMTADDVRDAVSDSGLIVLWRVPTKSVQVSEVELVVLRRTGGALDPRIYVRVLGRDVAHAKLVSSLYARVVDLAEYIEALR